MNTCEVCGKEFETKEQLAGHVGGEHSRVPLPIPHGTPRGYVMELRRGMPRCDECKAAWSAYQKERREARKGENA